MRHRQAFYSSNCASRRDAQCARKIIRGSGFLRIQNYEKPPQRGYSSQTRKIGLGLETIRLTCKLFKNKLHQYLSPQRARPQTQAACNVHTAIALQQKPLKANRPIIKCSAQCNVPSEEVRAAATQWLWKISYTVPVCLPTRVNENRNEIKVNTSGNSSS